MHGPDGRDYENRITFDEIVKPERLVYHHGGGDDVEPVQFRTTVTFEDLGGKTRVTLRGVFPSAEERARVIREYGADKGLVQTLGAARRIRGGDEAPTEHRHAGVTDTAFLSTRSKARRRVAMQVQPYLFFDGRCEEAIEFYKKALGAKVEMLMRFKDSPEPERRCARRGNENKIMHRCFKIGDTAVMASDGDAEGKPEFKGFSLSIIGEDRGRGRQACSTRCPTAARCRCR